MPTPTKVILDDADREKIQKARIATGMPQVEAASIAWPHMTPASGKATWARLETNGERAMNVTTLAPALEVVGLKLSGLKIQKVPV